MNLARLGDRCGYRGPGGLVCWRKGKNHPGAHYDKDTNSWFGPRADGTTESYPAGAIK